MYLFNKRYEFIKNVKFVNKNDEFVNNNWKGVTSEKRGKLYFLTRTCPPGLALASPDMSEVRVLVKFRTFRIQN